MKNKKIKTIRVTGSIEHRLPPIARQFLSDAQSPIIGDNGEKIQQLPMTFRQNKRKLTNRMKPKVRQRKV